MTSATGDANPPAAAIDRSQRHRPKDQGNRVVCPFPAGRGDAECGKPARAERRAYRGERHGHAEVGRKEDGNSDRNQKRTGEHDADEAPLAKTARRVGHRAVHQPSAARGDGA